MSLKSNKIVFRCRGMFLRTLTVISPELNTRVYYRFSQKKKINLKSPAEFNEKVLWLKLNTYRDNPLVKQCADKYRVREYIASLGLEDILNPLIHVYDDPSEITPEQLPDRFAMKLNVGCGYNIICKDKATFDLEAAKAQLKKWMKKKYYLTYSEMQYRNVKPKILVEKFIENSDGVFPDDYKFYCFHGEPKFLLYCTERSGAHALKSFYSAEGELVPYKVDCNEKPFDKPVCYERMLEVCRILSKEFPFVRVDLYHSDGRVIFGELTFTPAGGTGKYTEEGSRILGDMIHLENV